MPSDAASLRAVLDRWAALPPGRARNRVGRELHAALRELSPVKARELTTAIYRAFRAQESDEPRERRQGVE